MLCRLLETSPLQSCVTAGLSIPSTCCRIGDSGGAYWRRMRSMHSELHIQRLTPISRRGRRRTRQRELNRCEFASRNVARDPDNHEFLLRDPLCLLERRDLATGARAAGGQRTFGYAPCNYVAAFPCGLRTWPALARSTSPRSSNAPSFDGETRTTFEWLHVARRCSFRRSILSWTTSVSCAYEVSPPSSYASWVFNGMNDVEPRS